MRTVMALVAALVLGACASSPPVRHFLLDTPAGLNRDMPGSVAVGLGPFRWPEYLDRPQIVTRGPGSELRYDQFNRWAEPLEESFTRSVALNIDRRMEDVIVVIFPSGRLDELDIRIMGRVLRFDADSDGFAVLDVQWTLLEKGSDTPSFIRQGHYQAPIAADAGVPGITSAMSETVAQFSADVVATISERNKTASKE